MKKLLLVSALALVLVAGCSKTIGTTIENVELVEYPQTRNYNSVFILQDSAGTQFKVRNGNVDGTMLVKDSKYTIEYNEKFELISVKPTLVGEVVKEVSPELKTKGSDGK